MKTPAPWRAGARCRPIPCLLLLLATAFPAGAESPPPMSPAWKTEFKAQIAQLDALEKNHRALCARIDADHDLIDYLFYMDTPPPEHFIVMVGDEFPVLMNPDQVSKLAHLYALRELVADNLSDEARAWKQRFEDPNTPPCDTPEFWMKVLAFKHVEARGKLKGIFQTIYARDQKNRQKLQELTDQFDTTQQNLQKFLADSTPPPAASEDHLPKHEREFNQYMRQTQEILDANWRRFMQDQMSGQFKRKPAPGQPSAQGTPGAGPWDEPVNPTIGRELEEIFQRMDAITADIFR